MDWLNIERAQLLSQLSVVFFICMVIGILWGTLMSLKGKTFAAAITLSFGSCLVLNLTCSVLYFWQHWLR